MRTSLGFTIENKKHSTFKLKIKRRLVEFGEEDNSKIRDKGEYSGECRAKIERNKR